jgi:hypothetical protein
MSKRNKKIKAVFVFGFSSIVEIETLG